MHIDWRTYGIVHTSSFLAELGLLSFVSEHSVGALHKVSDCGKVPWVLWRLYCVRIVSSPGLLDMAAANPGLLPPVPCAGRIYVFIEATSAECALLGCTCQICTSFKFGVFGVESPIPGGTTS